MFGNPIRRLVPQRLRDRLRRRREIRKWERLLHESGKHVVPSPHVRPEKLYVSLTSYPPRFPTLHLTLLTLLQQTVQPDGILLWIAREDYPRLPRKVKALARRGIRICACDDIRSYKKLIFALETYPDSIIVTADDDVSYAPDWLDTLVAGMGPDERVVICHRAHRLSLTATGEIGPYREWAWDVQDPAARLASDNLVPVGVGGILYPPGCLSKEVTDRSLFMELSPTADDLWFYWMARRAGTRHRKVGGKFPRLAWPGSQEQRLFDDNKISGNDRQVQALRQAFGLPCPGRPLKKVRVRSKQR